MRTKKQQFRFMKSYIEGVVICPCEDMNWLLPGGIGKPSWCEGKLEHEYTTNVVCNRDRFECLDWWIKGRKRKPNIN